MGWTPEWSIPSKNKGSYTSSEASRPALGPIQFPIQRVPGAKWSEREADHSRHLVPRQTITGTLSLHFPYTFMTCKGQIYYYYCCYFIVILTTSEAFLPALHKSSMKQRKFRPISLWLTVFFFFFYKITHVLWRSSLPAVLCYIK